MGQVLSLVISMRINYFRNSFEIVFWKCFGGLCTSQYFWQCKFICSSFCWFKFWFLSDAFKVFVHRVSSSRFIRYFLIIFPSIILLQFRPLSEKKMFYCFPKSFTVTNVYHFEFWKALLFNLRKKICIEISLFL